jgi:hypothetical protein
MSFLIKESAKFACMACDANPSSFIVGGKLTLGKKVCSAALTACHSYL